MRFLSDLAGTLRNAFRIGANLFKSSAGRIEARNKDDTEDVAIRAREVQIRDPNSGFVYRVTVPTSSPAYLSGDLDFALPPDSGSSNQALLTDGAGNTYWGTVATGANAVKSDEELITPSSGVTTVVVAPPQGALIQWIKIGVVTAFDEEATVEVGVAGQTARYMQASQSDLQEAGTVWEVLPLYKDDASDPSDRQIIITLDAQGATVGAARVVVIYSNPD